MKPIVLDEDTYTEAISHIIERDFFPHLAKGRTLEGLLEKRLDASFPTENIGSGINFYNENATNLADRVNLNLSLDQFQTLYTSEDNASFAEILEKTNLRQREKYHWLYNNAQRRIEGAPQEKGAIKYNPKNALMYFPEGTGESTVDEKSSRAAPKAIVHDNTRVANDLVPSIQAANTRAPTELAAAQGKMTPWRVLAGDETDTEAPEFRGYRLVDSTPVLSPTRMGTPLMTWGEIEGTPALISGSETPGPRFSLPSISRREELGKKLSEKASRSHRRRMLERERAVRGTPRSGAGLMSPAAQHLFKRSSAHHSKGFEGALRDTYAPSSPLSRQWTGRRTTANTPTPLFRAGATPSTSSFQLPTTKK